MPPAGSGHARLAGLGLFVVALASLLALVLDRIGVPALLLATLATVIATACVLLAGVTGGTMRFPDFLDAGRVMSGSSGSLVFAMVAAPAFGLGSGAPVAVGLVLLAMAGGRILQASGAAGWADYLRIRYGSRPLSALVACLAAGAGLALASAGSARLVDLVSAATGIGRGAAAVVCCGIILVVVVPGGAKGLVRAALMAGIIGLACGGILTVVSVRAGVLRGTDLYAVFSGIDWIAPALLAAMLPSTAMAVGTSRNPGAASRGLLGAALLVLILDLVTPTAGAGLIGAAAPAVLAFAGTFTAVAGLCLAAGAAIARDLPGPPARYTPLSRRFAGMRCATALAVVVAGWIGAHRPDLAQVAWEPAGAILLAMVLPPVFTGLLAPRARGLAAWVAILAGAGVAGAVQGGLLALSGGPALAGVWGAAAGLAAGLAAGAIFPARRPSHGVPDGSGEDAPAAGGEPDERHDIAEDHQRDHEQRRDEGALDQEEDRRRRQEAGIEVDEHHRAPALAGHEGDGVDEPGRAEARPDDGRAEGEGRKKEQDA
jgi:hypothetical protein